MKPEQFKEKVVVVTGAASGIGAALCRRFAENGAKIGLVDMDEENARLLEKELAAKGAPTCVTPCDVANENSCINSMETIHRRLGEVDILVNNAGITLRDTFRNTKPSAYKKVMDVNFFGSLYWTKVALDSLIKQKGMVIVTSSIAGIAPLPGRTGYCASKFALHGLFETLRLEMKPYGVHVMMVCPTFVSTELQTRALGGDGRITTHPQSTMGKEQTPEALAKIICDGALKRKNQIIPTFQGKLAWFIHALAPGIYDWIVLKQFESELAG
jgi:short-subunit dehydrogenase